MRHLGLVLILVLLEGCAAPIAVRDPQTGATVTCSTPESELNPWSQSEACVAGHIAQGWTIVR
jgi:hypothetical protein